MENREKLKKIVKPLVKWFQENARELPWREGKDPYKIWLSEIMLQQTKIEVVKNYYLRFIEEIPNIQDLASVEEEKLLKLWEGLGYYNRVRNLKKAAIVVKENYQGKMPKTYQELITLPGIGEYTAGAIASIAYNEKIVAVDGNVLRVISRVIGSKQDVLLPNTKKEITQILKEIMPEQSGNFNEGLMELGERICIPNGQPLCEKCPIYRYCIAYEQELTLKIPVREKKIKKRKEQKTVLVLLAKNKIAIQKRGEKGLLAKMYQFPNMEGIKSKKEVKEILKQCKLEPIEIEEIGKYKHIFSHIEWDMIGYRIQVKEENKQYIWVEKEEELNKYPIPMAFEKFRREII